MNEKMREEFEQAIAIEAGQSLVAIQLSRKDDSYSTSPLMYAWWAWQQSRETLVIELPSDTCIKVNNYTPFEMRDFFERSARRLGLKVTP